VGSTILTAARYGTARGLFTNEAGMGTGPMAAAAGPCKHPAQEALISMTGVFWDTVVICAMTGLMLVTAMLGDPQSFQGAGPGQLCQIAFSCLPGGEWILTGSLTVFAFGTIVGWSYYGSCCWRYLRGNQSLYLGLYLLAVFFGVFFRLETLWSLGGILAGLMAAVNLSGLFLLRQEAAETLRGL
jgi:AGCS family alanine or glycine:cation symporter